MNIAITFRNFEPSEHLRKYATRRFDKLQRFTSKSEQAEMTVVLSVDKHRHCADVQFFGDGYTVSAVEESGDMYGTVDLILDKLESLLKKHSSKQREKRRDAAKAAPVYEVFNYSTRGSGEQRIVVGEDKFESKPLFAEEAALQLEQRDDEFLVFLNADNGRINVMYRKKNGGFGLIDPEI